MRKNIKEMIRLRKKGYTYSEIGKNFNISRQYVHLLIGKIKKGEKLSPSPPHTKFTKIYSLLLKRIEDSSGLSQDYKDALSDVNKLFISVEPLCKLIK